MTPLSITLYLLHTDTESDGAQLSHHLTKRARDEELLHAFARKGGKGWKRGIALLDLGTEEGDEAFVELITNLSESPGSCDSWTTEEIEVDAAPLLTALMVRVEADHFRTVTDTGAHPCAMTVWHALRVAAGLLPLRHEDLPDYDPATKAYVTPEGSRLLVKPAPVPFNVPTS